MIKKLFIFSMIVAFLNIKSTYEYLNENIKIIYNEFNKIVEIIDYKNKRTYLVK